MYLIWTCLKELCCTVLSREILYIELLYVCVVLVCVCQIKRAVEIPICVGNLHF